LSSAEGAACANADYNMLSDFRRVIRLRKAGMPKFVTLTSDAPPLQPENWESVA
jgi:hypothetical protein